jgi:hypothetical protein
VLGLDSSPFCRPSGACSYFTAFSGVPFGHPRLAYKPAQHLTVAPFGG